MLDVYIIHFNNITFSFIFILTATVGINWHEYLKESTGLTITLFAVSFMHLHNIYDRILSDRSK